MELPPGIKTLVEPLRAGWEEVRRKLPKVPPSEPVDDKHSLLLGCNLLLFGPFLILIVFSLFKQVGFLSFAGMYLATFVVPVTVLVLKDNRKLAIWLFVLLLILGLWKLVGSSRPWLDVLTLLVALPLALGMVSPAHLRAWRARARVAKADVLTTREALYVAGLFLAVGWALLSMADYAGGGLAGRPAVDAGKRVAQKNWPRVAVGLALSGGGYRAALFHAGVLQKLDELGVPVEAISSVSGGSIAAAFYTQGHAPREFLDAVARGGFNLKRRLLRMDNAARSLSSMHLPLSQTVRPVWFADDFDRTLTQAQILDDLFLDGTRHRTGSRAGRPELMICVTETSQGLMLGITPEGVVYVGIRSLLERMRFANPANLGTIHELVGQFIPGTIFGLPGEERLSRLAAASGAFPLALAGYRVQTRYTLPGHAVVPIGYLLADGGITDNTGLVLLDAAQNLADRARREAGTPAAEKGQNPTGGWGIGRWNVDLMIASDGSSLTPRAMPRGALSEFARAMDVMYDMTGGEATFVKREREDSARRPVVLLSPRSVALPPQSLNLKKSTVDSRYVPALDRATLQYVAAQMPKGEREQAERLLGRLDANNRAKGELSQLVYRELDRCVRAFVGTSTLADQVAPEIAERIFHLGEYMVLFNRASLDCNLARAGELKDPATRERARSCAAGL